MRRVAIIGSGPTAIYTAHYLLWECEDLAITMFESQAQAGKGTPYHQDWSEKEMLANIASIELPPITETLVHWLTHRSDDQLARLGIARDNITERTFFPRVALGEYFQHQLEKLVTLAPASGNSLTVKVFHPVLDVEITDEGALLTIREKGKRVCKCVFDYVVMATGHAWPKEPEIKPGYFLSPWPSPALKTIPDCHIGIRGTSLSAIDAMVNLSVARGSFVRAANGELTYLPDPGTDSFRITMLSRKGVLPEADFYCPIPYLSLQLFTKAAMDALLVSLPPARFLDAAFELFKAELAHCDPAYAAQMHLETLSLEQFSYHYFYQRETSNPFLWAEANLKEAKENMARRHTVAWRYAILRMHEVIAYIVPKLTAEDMKRFNLYLKPIFVDDYATVPHESIERLLALHRAGKLDVIKAGEEYILDTQTPASGAIVKFGTTEMHFPAFIEATGQRTLSIHEFPFESLWRQGIIEKATAPYASSYPGQYTKKTDIGGINLDPAFHPVSHSTPTARLYCLSLPFMLGQFPFAQGITSSHEMGKKVAADMAQQFLSDEVTAPIPGTVSLTSQGSSGDDTLIFHAKDFPSC